LSGIGFIGGGAILKEGGNVRGLATAASIWVTGAVGAAVALGREEIALVMSLIAFGTLHPFSPVVQSNRSANNSDSRENDRKE
jgi:putative Mg2+ transporter-C (MgtC) family protein